MGEGLLSTSSTSSLSSMSMSALFWSTTAVTVMPAFMLDDEVVGTTEVGIAVKRAEGEVVGRAEVGIAEKMAEMEDGLAGRERAFARKKAVMRRSFMYRVVVVVRI